MKSKGRIIFTILVLLCVSTIHAAKPLSNKAQFSFLVGAPNNSSVFSIFGHASLRIIDPELNLDYVFNYGIFDQTQAANILQLLKGNLFCELWVYDTEEYLGKIRQMGIEMKEHLLNLLPEERETLWQQLITMGQNQSGRYRYDILRTNCVTLPLISIEKAISGKIIYDDSGDWYKGSYSSIGEPYVEKLPWHYFFAYLFFGSSTNQLLSFRESLFLPYNLEAAFQSAVIETDTDSRPLLYSSKTLIEGVPEKITCIFTPLMVGWILFVFIFILSIFEWRKKSYYRIIDCILYGIAGFFGLILFLLNTVFVEWYNWFGYNLLWLHPFHLLGVVFFVRKKFDNPAYYYHCFNLVALVIGAIAVCNFGILTRQLTVAAPYMLVLGTRSVFGLMRYYKSKKIIK